MSEPHALVLLLTIELLIPHARSLKQKRAAIKGLKDRIRSRHNASVAEIAYLDKWQRAMLAVALVGTDRRYLESEAGHLEQLTREIPDVQPVSARVEWL